MVHSSATTVDAYLAEVDDRRRPELSAVRDVILGNLPEGYEEAMRWGMISYEVPLARFADTYNGEPLMYAALAAQKRHMAVYLTTVYADPARLEAFRERYAASGRKLDMGKSCVRFTRLEHLPLDLVGDTIASTSVDAFIDLYRSAREAR